MRKTLCIILLLCGTFGIHAQSGKEQLRCEYLTSHRGEVFFHITNVTDSIVYLNWRIYDPRANEYKYNLAPESIAPDSTLSLDPYTIDWCWLKGETIDIYPHGGKHLRYECRLYDLVYEAQVPYHELKEVDVYHSNGTLCGTGRYNHLTWRVLFLGKYYELVPDKYDNKRKWLGNSVYYVRVR